MKILRVIRKRLRGLSSAVQQPASTAAVTAQNEASEAGPFRGTQHLRRGEAWRSDDGRTVLRMSSSGQLSLSLDDRIAWRPPVQKPARKLMLNDGMLTLYDMSSVPIWTQGVLGKAIELRLQDDGNMVLYQLGKPLWFSDTRHQAG